LGLYEYEHRYLSELIPVENYSVKTVRRLAKEIKNRRESEELPPFHSYAFGSESRDKRNDRIMNKAITLLKTTMIKFNDIVGHTTEDDWIVRDMLTEQSRLLHMQIDALLKYENKLRRTAEPS
jgi:hypothetical protein